MKSKRLYCLMFGLLLFCVGICGTTLARAYSEAFSSGKNWLQKMSRGEKFISIYAPMILFHRYGINFRKSPNEYIEKIDEALINNPYLEKEDVANIFASTVYTYEPETRRAFKLMEMEFAHQDLSPHLMIKTDTTPELSQAVE